MSEKASSSLTTNISPIPARGSLAYLLALQLSRSAERLQKNEELLLQTLDRSEKAIFDAEMKRIDTLKQELESKDKKELSENIQTGVTTASSILSLLCLSQLSNPYVIAAVVCSSLLSFANSFLLRTNAIEKITAYFTTNNKGEAAAKVRLILVTLPLLSSLISLSTLPSLLRSNPSQFMKTLNVFMDFCGFASTAAQKHYESKYLYAEGDQKVSSTKLEEALRVYEERSKAVEADASVAVERQETEHFTLSLLLDAFKVSQQPG